MAWYDEAVFYHIYPLGLAGAPKQNDYGEPVHRLPKLIPWIEHIRRLGFTALYIGPLFQSVGHGYETTDYRTLDSRLGTNEDLADFVRICHEAGIKVVFDGVFNHTGRDFFAFADIRQNRENSSYCDWYCNVNFWGNNEYNDGFSYDNWGGYDLLAKLNQRNPAVREYICDVVRFWVSEFDVDGIRLDAADVLDFDFMRDLRRTADEVKPDFWLMGEVIHGDYSRWANDRTLHSVTDYALHKGLYSGHNDHNYFEIAHTVRRTLGMVPSHIKLYNFVDNHDVDRISTKLLNKAHYLPVHILLYTLPGIPSVYYGSEFGIEGKKERFSDDSLRPCIDLAEHADDYEHNPCVKLIAALGRIHANYSDDLSWGDYRELSLTTEQYAFGRGNLIVAVNNAETKGHLSVDAPAVSYVGLLGGESIKTVGGRLEIELNPCGGNIFAPSDYVPADGAKQAALEQVAASFAAKVSQKKPGNEGEAEQAGAKVQEVEVPNIPYEQMSVEELQAAILAKMAANGPVTDQMRRDVTNNVWPDSLLNWVRSF
ncbi:MAG: hypothetical protein IKF78_04195 [Atopobiaceae bacterium]|nr:hypothetical protein [Atopobiaceae bacterium]